MQDEQDVRARTAKVQRPVGVFIPGVLTVRLSIGGVTTSIASADPDLRITLPDAVARFATPDGDPAISADARWTTEPPFSGGRNLFDTRGLWQLHDVDGQLAWTFTTPKFGPLPYKTAIFESDLSAGTVYLHRPYFETANPIYPLEYPLDELLVTNWLARGRGVEIHGCAVRDADGSGYLFAGHSGAGKTTIARLWNDVDGICVLSDDRVILRQDDEGIWMYGTPWHGDEPLAMPMRTRLTRGFFLSHGARNSIADVRLIERVAKLFACSFPPFFSRDGLDFTITFLSSIASAVTFFDLAFIPDNEIVEFVRAAR